MSIEADDNSRTIAPSRNLARFSPEVAWLLRRIDSALTAIEQADIWPSSAEALRFSAQVGTIHYSTLIEGNRLGLLEAERAARGQLDAQTKAEIELVNYVDALKLIDERLDHDGLTFDERLFKDIHYQATKGLGTPEGPFKPHHEGEWRDGEAGVWDPLAGVMVHTGSPQAEVRPRMLGLIEWIAEAEERPVDWPIAVVAGVLHYTVAEVHPFADGNGRTARLLTSAFLTRHDMTPGRMFNFDAHYGKDKDAYLAALRSVRERTYNQEWWMRYFLTGLAEEYERVIQEVTRLAAIGRTGKGERVQLTATQERALTELAMRKVVEFNREDYQGASGLGRSAAAEDLRRLTDARVIVPRGQGPSRRYRLAARGTESGHAGHRRAPREWPDERIEAELRTLVGEDDRFPSVRRFDEAGRRDLYQAIFRTGGSKVWSDRLGIQPPRRGRPPT
jgi:Fic family protein